MKKNFTKFFLLAIFSIASFSLSAQTYNGGTWYSLYETGERTLSTIDSETLNAFTPVGTNLTFDAKRAATGQGNLKVAPIVNGQQQSDIFDQKPGKVTKKNFLGIESQVDYTDAPYSATVSNSNSNQIKFYTVTGATLNKYFKNVKLPLKKHILIADGGYGKSSESKSFENVTIGGTSNVQTVNLRSFLTTNDITITSDNSAFRIGSANNTSGQTFAVGANACASTNGSGAAGGGNLGNINQYPINIYFCPSEAKTYNATITITDGTSTAKISVSGVGVKKNQSIVWDEEFSADEVKLPVGKEINNIASATSALEISYSFDKDSIISIEGTTIKALKSGVVILTATQAGNNEWNGVSAAKTITVTEKIIQAIHWEDYLRRLKIGGDDVTLSATAMLLTNAETNEYTESPERTALITYSSNNNAVVSVDGKILKIIGEGETSVVATLPGDEYYEAITIEMPVKVSALSSLCEAYVLDDAKERELNTVDSEEYSINGPAHQLTFTANRTASWRLSGGNLKVDAYYNGDWHNVFDEDVTKDSYTSYGPITLDRNTTKLKFYTELGATGYKHIKDVTVTQVTYLETTTSSIVVEKSIIGDVIEKSIQVQYSNLPEGVLISNTSDKITLSTSDLNSDCGKYSEQTINFTIIPTEVGTIEDVITIYDEATKLSLNIPVTVHTQRNTQTIIWNDEVNSIYTIDNITFSAEAKTAITYESSDNNIAEVQNNQLIIKTSGVVTITATAAQDEKYEQATATKTITISKATPVLEELPIATSITYGSTLGTSILEGGSTNVDGTWEWNADVAQVLNAGINNVSVLFTPANTAWYDVLEATVALTVNKADQVLTWDFANQELTAGSTLTLNASATCGEVTYTISDNDGVVTLDGTTLTAHKAGVVTIQASHAGDANHNSVASATYTITIVHATPSITAWPTLADVTYGATLEQALVLVGGEASVEGVFAITDELELAIVPNAGTYTYNVTFTPEATEKYTTVSATVTLIVNKADQELSWDFANQELTAGSTLTLNASATCGDVTYTLSDNDGVVTLDGTTLTVHKVGTVTLQASHAGDANHNAVVSAIYTITIVHATPSITAWPTLADVTYGATLEQALVLVGGEASVEGEFAITDELELATVPNAGTYTYNVTFTPEATEKYNTVSGTVALTRQ